MFEKNNFPKRFWQCQGREIPLEHRPPLKDWIAKWEDRESPEQGLYLYGPSAKTELMFAVCMKEVMMRNHRAFTISALAIADFVLKNPELTEYEALMKLSEPDLLGVYCFGREFRDNFGVVESVLSKVFNYRRDDKKPIIFSSELRAEDLKNYYIPQVIDGVLSTSQVLPIW